MRLTSLALGVWVCLVQTAPAQQILVQYPKGSPKAFLKVGDRFAGGVVTMCVPEIRMIRFKTTPQRESAMMNTLKDSGQFSLVWKDSLRRASEVPNDPFLPSQWGASNIRLSKAWDVQKGNPATVVGVIDSGISPNHPDLTNFVPKWDYVDGDASPWDLNGHGSHVAGTIGATVNNNLGVAGVGRNCSMYIYRVLDASGSGYTSDVTAAIVAATNQGCHVINMSLGSSASDPGEESACDYAVNQGVIVVASAGNDNWSNPNYPAHYSPCLAVGSIDSSSNRSSFSNYGSWVDVAAPGTTILSTVLNSGYAYYSGTSMASPHVAGIAALAYANFAPERSAEVGLRVRGFIETSARPVPGRWCNFGTVDARNAVGLSLQLAVHRREYTDPPFEFRLVSVAHDGPDEYLAAGYSFNPSSNLYSPFVGRYSADGTVLWSRGFPWANNVLITGIKPDGRGGAFVSGGQNFRFAVFHVRAGGSAGTVLERGHSGGVSQANDLVVVNGRATVVGNFWNGSSQRPYGLQCGAEMTDIAEGLIDYSIANYGVAQCVVYNPQRRSYLAMTEMEDVLFGKGVSVSEFKRDGALLLGQRVVPFIYQSGLEITANDICRFSNGQFGFTCAAGIRNGGNWKVSVGKLWPSGSSSYLSQFSIYDQWLTPESKSSTIRATPFGPTDLLVTASVENTQRSSGYVLVARFNSSLNLSQNWPNQGYGNGVRMLSGSKAADATAGRAVVTSELETYVSGNAYDLSINPGSTHATLWKVSKDGDWSGHSLSFRNGQYDGMSLGSTGRLVCSERVTEGAGFASLNRTQVKHLGRDGVGGDALEN
ncbi:MAG: S8 family serine peptidase [Chthonomonadaceae bacterium]|nr:S8 family serine peptidase [Chthonomonadaceae bacterium]